MNPHRRKHVFKRKGCEVGARRVLEVEGGEGKSQIQVQQRALSIRGQFFKSLLC